jgi:hypothetical protein
MYVYNMKHLYKKGRISWNKGKKHSESTKDKMRASHKAYKEKYGKHPGRTRKGKESNLWKGGVTPIKVKIHDSPLYTAWRQQCFIRDNFTCQRCKGLGGKLEVHHKKSFSKLLNEAKGYMPLLSLYDAAMLYTPLWDINNGITYCRECHIKHKHPKMRAILEKKNARDAQSSISLP